MRSFVIFTYFLNKPTQYIVLNTICYYINILYLTCMIHCMIQLLSSKIIYQAFIFFVYRFAKLKNHFNLYKNGIKKYTNSKQKYTNTKHPKPKKSILTTWYDPIFNHAGYQIFIYAFKLMIL